MDVQAIPGTADVRATPAREPREDELDVAARGFEKLLVQRLLKDARQAEFGEERSNARATYDAMYDEAIAGLITDSGTLGLADAIRGSLEATGAVSVEQVPDRPGADPGTAGLASDASRVAGLDAASLRTLRTLLSADDATGGTVPLTAMRDATAVPALATLSATERLASGAEGRNRERAFIDRLRPHAEASARRLNTSSAAIIAIAAHESGWGRHPITDAAGRDSNNLFGIKSHGRDGPSVQQRTSEYLGGTRRSVLAEFRAYASPAESVADFATFLLENPRYAPALEQAGDEQRFLRGLQEAGYATDPTYADKTLRVLERVRAHLAGEPAS